MSEHDTHKLNTDRSAELFDKLDVPWAKSKDAIWAEMQEKIESPATKQRRLKQFYVPAAAALVMILFGMGLFFRLYTQTSYCPAGQHVSINLPDGSVVQMNADSRVNYHPYWWRFDRKLEFEGEAFFEVKTGSAFTVISKTGSTTVLGTKFNIYSRGEDYEVTCLSGKVRVEAPHIEKKVILMPGEKAAVTSEKEITVKKNVQLEQHTAWMEKKFIFTNEPLNKVFEEIARQYDIKIELKAVPNQPYSGRFSMAENPEELLNNVCVVMNLSCKQLDEGEYQIVKNP